MLTFYRSGPFKLEARYSKGSTVPFPEQSLGKYQATFPFISSHSFITFSLQDAPEYVPHKKLVSAILCYIGAEVTPCISIHKNI